MADSGTPEKERVPANEEINREAARLGITPQAVIRRLAEDHFREEHDAIVARIMRTQEKELKTASPDDRHEIKEHHAFEVVSSRRLLDIEIRQVAAVVERGYLLRELDEERRQAPRAGVFASAALNTRHEREANALSERHTDDICFLRAEQEAGDFDPKQWNAELKELTDMQALEELNMFARQELECMRESEPARENRSKASSRGKGRNKENEIER
jgi:hypothetical protein